MGHFSKIKWLTQSFKRALTALSSAPDFQEKPHYISKEQSKLYDVPSFAKKNMSFSK